MATFFNEIVQEARALAAEDRTKLAETLPDSLHAPLSEIETARALAFPLAGSPANKNTGRVFLKELPFAVVYRSDAYGITIFALAHRSRRPSYWQLRTQVS